ncbi:MAG: hypothetical protein AABY11_03655 [archaeon]|mgnify:CR=1 FL=1
MSLRLRDTKERPNGIRLIMGRDDPYETMSIITVDLIVGTRHPGELHVTTPAIRSKINLSMEDSRVGRMVFMVDHRRKEIITERYYPIQEKRFAGMGLANLVELQVEKVFEKEFKGYTIQFDPDVMDAKREQLLKRERTLGKNIPIEEAVKNTRAYVIENAKKNQNEIRRLKRRENSVGLRLVLSRDRVENTIKYRFVVGNHEKGIPFVTSPEIKKAIMNERLSSEDLFGQIELTVKPGEKMLITTRVKPVFSPDHLRKGIATLLELMVERDLLKKYQGFSIVAQPPLPERRVAQLAARERTAGVPIPLEFAAEATRQKVIRSHRIHRKAQRRRM